MTVVSPPGSEEKLIVLLNNDEVGSPAANEICVYLLPKMSFVAIISLEETPYCEFFYCDQSLLAVPYLSRQIHFLNPQLEPGMVYILQLYFKLYVL